MYQPIFKRFNLVKEALIEIGCVVTSLVVSWLVGCHAPALWPNGASLGYSYYGILIKTSDKDVPTARSE